MVAQADAEVAAAEGAVAKQTKIAEEAIAKGKALREKTAQTIEAFTMRIEQHKAARKAWEAQQERFNALDENLERYRSQAFDQLGLLEEEEAALDELTTDLRTLEIARKVLSVGGVRAYLLARSLDTITDMANVWLARLCTERVLELKLSPYTEKAKGGIKESIALEVLEGSRRLQAVGRTRQGRIFQVWSDDGGTSWGKMTLTALPNPNAGTDAVTLKDGRQLLVYNHTTKGRSPLNLAVSADGQEWQAALVLEDEPGNEFSYPAVIQTRDGLVHITYTWKRQRIRHAVIDPAELQPRAMPEGEWPLRTPSEGTGAAH